MQRQKPFLFQRLIAFAVCWTVLIWSGLHLFRRWAEEWSLSYSRVGFVPYGYHESQFAADGSRLVIGFQKQSRVLDLATGEVLSELEQYNGQGLAGYSSQGMIISGFSRDATNVEQAVIWNDGDGKRIGSISIQAEDCFPIFSPDGEMIVVVFDQGLATWDSISLVQRGRIAIDWPEQAWLPGRLAWNPRNQELIVIDDSGKLHRVDWDRGIAEPFLAAQEMRAQWARWSSDGTKLLTLNEGGLSLSVWEIQSGRMVTTISGGPFSQAAFSPDGESIVTSSQVKGVFQGRAAASSAWDRRTKIWDSTTGTLLVNLENVGFTQLSPDWEYLVETGPEGLRLAKWNGSRSQRFPAWFDGHGCTCTFGPSNRYLASVNGSGRVAVWERRDLSNFWKDCLTSLPFWLAISATFVLSATLVLTRIVFLARSPPTTGDTHQ